MASTGPDVLAVLVATDGEPWLPEVLDALEAQTYEHLDVVAIDNGSQDGSRELLLSHLSEQRVLVAERDLGFGGAVGMALDANPVGDLVLLIHDDLALAPDAVEQLVGAMSADPRLAIVGPKLLQWDDPALLQQIGWTVDVTGRADMGVEPDERDQGQRDDARRPLVVSTAGMLVRRDVFDALGRFDRRYHVFRDDLDLCWRAWLAGWEVEAVPEAVGRHVRAAADYHRLGQSAFLGPRYFAERNTLASLLKNYGGLRLAYVVPLFLVVGLAKTVGFLATRQVGAAWQTIRAWVWNVLHLPGTLQLRREAQRMRRRTDGEVQERFGRIGPRLRAYGEAIADRLTGGELRVDTSSFELGAEPATATAKVIASLRRHPVGWTAAGLLVVGLVLALPLLAGGPLRGGDIAPFPTSSSVFLEDYVASWHDAGPFGTSAAPSPAQAMLGILQFLVFGSSYLASRLLVLGAVPAAWLLSLRAVRPLAPSRGPRVAAATVYVLSPTALAAVRTGEVGALVLLVGLPAFAAAIASSFRRVDQPTSSWRAAAVAILTGAGIIAFEPVAALGIGLAYAVTAVIVAARPGTTAARRRAWLRILVMVTGTLAVLFPWSLTLLQADGPVTGGLSRRGANAEPFWRWLLQAPQADGFSGVVAGAGVVLAGIFGLLFAARRRPIMAGSLWGAAVLGAVVATATSRAGADAWVWPGTPLLVTSASFAALFAVGLRSVAHVLEAHDFGWRQVGAVTMVIGALVGAVASLGSVVTAQWEGYDVGAPPLPAFVTAEAATTPDARIVTIADHDGAVQWDVAPAAGPTMAGFGTPRPTGFVQTVNQVVEAIVGGSDPAASGRLGLLNVRYVIVPEAGRSDDLERALARQLDLEPRPVAEGQVYAVSAFLPRVAWVTPATRGTIERRGTPPTEVDAIRLERSGSAAFRGEVPGDGAVLVSETEVGAWHARLPDGREIPAVASSGLVSIDVPATNGEVVVEHGRQARRTAAVAIQVLAVLLVLSVVLRPPSSPVQGVR